MFYQIFLSSQVKRSGIISNKHGIYELPHELPLHEKRSFPLRISSVNVTKSADARGKKEMVDTSKKLLKIRN